MIEVLLIWEDFMFIICIDYLLWCIYVFVVCVLNNFVLFEFFGRFLFLEMVRYVREDIYYLFYISDRLYNEFIKSGNVNSNLL